jgi:hypothetical protein
MDAHKASDIPSRIGRSCNEVLHEIQMTDYSIFASTVPIQENGIMVFILTKPTGGEMPR